MAKPVSTRFDNLICEVAAFKELGNVEIPMKTTKERTESSSKQECIRTDYLCAWVEPFPSERITSINGAPVKQGVRQSPKS